MVITLYVIQGSIKKRMSKSVRFTTAAVNIGVVLFMNKYSCFDALKFFEQILDQFGVFIVAFAI